MVFLHTVNRLSWHRGALTSDMPTLELSSLCSFPIADHFNSLGVINKQDYARRHGWELHLSAENVDPSAVVSHCIEPPLIQFPSSIKQDPSMLCGTIHASLSSRQLQLLCSTACA